MNFEIFQKNEDLKRLIDKGYSLDIVDGYLVVRDIPYLDSNKALLSGTFVSKITLIDGIKLAEGSIDHQMYFDGGIPHEMDGNKVSGINPRQQSLGLTDPKIQIKHIFSNKPSAGYKNYYDKVVNYTKLISGPAMNLHSASPYTRKLPSDFSYVGPFAYIDTLSGRAELGKLNDNFREDKVAIIGLGGTGSYVLDLISKTPVEKIVGFDADTFMVHNAFRAPGRLKPDELNKPKSKVYENRYKSFHKGLKCLEAYIDSDSTAELRDITFAFVCVDSGKSREGIFSVLKNLKIPFIDVGMGLNKEFDSLSGLIRTTYYATEQVDAQMARELSDMSDDVDDEYRTNIQIAELNSINACLAVIKFKQLRGFYKDEKQYNHILLNPTKPKIQGEKY